MATDKKVLIETSPDPEAVSRSRGARRWWQLGGRDVSYVSVDISYENESSASSSEDLVKNVDNVWTAPEATELYKPIAGYEGAHRFEPTATWSAEEEQKLVRRVRVATVEHFNIANMMQS